MNQELFAQVNGILSLRPENFDMESWEMPGHSECTTTRCLAGWGIFLTTGQPLKQPGRFGGGSVYSDATRSLARELGVRADFSEIGAKLFDLNKADAIALFYAPGHVAVRFIAAAAVGNETEAYRILREYENTEGDAHQ